MALAVFTFSKPAYSGSTAKEDATAAVPTEKLPTHFTAAVVFKPQQVRTLRLIRQVGAVFLPTARSCEGFALQHAAVDGHKCRLAFSPFPG